ncbi:hypothetical protein CHLNCDRAFT_144434 [Chlorella variabilis]|uniref:Uncharacterized protein n=1 Tax=Chlorella variabilis TaxID=554065 RepID=E1ZBF5_CHLVA|nr:hypothetical protein CHLNCDRAFT_144434 [Chlorella variabilis]EFN56638.1 hypothetical protein CHLNCDRAFT_144434 [Chlorella variabilis]|eukprot:XP_005848740.1 hypothetical protein CHLNCDRAFT_144434 [Chlorella variabilis]
MKSKRQRCGGPLGLDHPALNSTTTECQAYRRVCFDQGSVISFDEAHSPANRTSVPIPRLNITHLVYNWAGLEGNNDRLRRSLSSYEPLAYRFGSGALEASPDLRQPLFSNCTVPVVMWTNWIHNFAEAFSHVAARVWALQDGGAMSRAATLVVGTPAGERLPDFLPTLLRPFTPHPFSQRCGTSGGEEEPSPGAAAGRPASSSSAAAGGPANSSSAAAGGPASSGAGRCFQTAYLCAFLYGYYQADYGAAQAIFSHYQLQLPPLPAEARFQGGPEVLKVLINRRHGPVRNLLNSAALVQACNDPAAWRGLAGAQGRGSPIRRVQCREAGLGGDGLANMAAVRAADVLVCLHGAACTNWLFMSKGSALLEIRPYQFGSLARFWADAHFAQIAEATGHQVFWYGLNIEDPALSKPSQLEAARPAREGSSGQLKEARDRHVLLPFDALQAMLLQIAAAGRRRDAHLRQRGSGEHYAELLPGGQLHAVAAAAAGADGRDGTQAAAAGVLALLGGGPDRRWWPWGLLVAVGAAMAAAVVRMRGAAPAGASGLLSSGRTPHQF